MADALWMNADPDSGEPEYDARELRRGLGTVLFPMSESGNAGRFGARSGVHPSGGAQLCSLSGGTVTVSHLRGVISPELTTVQGPYLVQIESHEHTMEPADTSNPRRDIVVLRIYDDDEDASGARTAVTEYIVGNPAASPQEPAVPAGAIRIASINVPASGTGSATLTNNAPFTVASGGVLPVRNGSELPTGTGLYAGMTVWRQDAKEMQVYDGGFWWTIGEVPKGFTFESTDIIYGHGGATRSVQQRYWLYLAPRLVWCNWYVSFASTGAGSNELTLGAPTDIERTSRQFIPGALEMSGAPNGRVLQAVSFTGSSGDRFDRVKWSGGNQTQNGTSNMVGDDINASMLMMFNGMYREA